MKTLMYREKGREILDKMKQRRCGVSLWSWNSVRQRAECVATSVKGHLSVLCSEFWAPVWSQQLKDLCQGGVTENSPRSLQVRRLQGTKKQEATHLEQSQIGSCQIAKKTVKFSLFRTVATIPHVAIENSVNKNKLFSSSVSLASSQQLILDSTDIEHFCCHRKFYWTAQKYLPVVSDVKKASVEVTVLIFVEKGQSLAGPGN